MSEKIDGILKAIAKSVHEPEHAMSITLLVKGVVVTGELIKPSLREMFTSIPGRDNMFDEYVEIPLEQESQVEENEIDEQDFIYLKPVRLLQSGITVSLSFPGPMRIKISSVDAFLIGEIETSKQ